MGMCVKLYVAAAVLVMCGYSKSSQPDYIAICPGEPSKDEVKLYKILFKELYQITGHFRDLSRFGVEPTIASKLVACFPITFEIFCDSEECSPGNCSFNESKYSFMWTSFNISDPVGDILLNIAIYGIRVFGFEWENDCDVYRKSSVVSLNITNDELPCVPESDMCFTLQYLTMQLPTWSAQKGVQGYAVLWDSKIDLRKHIKGDFIGGFVGVLCGYGLFLFLFSHSVYNFIHKKIPSKKTSAYFYFWGCQIMIFAFMFVMEPIFLTKRQHYKKISWVFYILSLGINLVTALQLCWWIYNHSGKQPLPVPFSCLYGKRVKEWYILIFNFIAILLTLLLLTYLLQALPNILIAFYTYPSRTLIRLSFFQMVIVGFIFGFAGLLYTVERLIWLCYFRCKKVIPYDLGKYDFIWKFQKDSKKSGCEEISARVCKQGGDIQKTGIISEDDQVGDASISVLQINIHTSEKERKTKKSLGSEKSDSIEEYVNICTTSEDIKIDESYFNERKTKINCEIILLILQSLATMIGLIGFGGLIYILCLILFKQSDDGNQLQGLLTILPAVAVNSIFFLTKWNSKDMSMKRLKNFIDGDILNNEHKNKPILQNEDYINGKIFVIVLEK